MGDLPYVALTYYFLEVPMSYTISGYKYKDTILQGPSDYMEILKKKIEYTRVRQISMSTTHTRGIYATTVDHILSWWKTQFDVSDLFFESNTKLTNETVLGKRFALFHPQLKE